VLGAQKMAFGGGSGMSGSQEVRTAAHGISDAFAKLTVIGLIVALLAVLAQVAAGPGRQLGLWDHTFGFRILEWTAYVGIGAGGAALIGVFFAWGIGQRRLITLGLTGVVLGALVAYWPWALQRSFRIPPPLYDISTDTANPPRFVAGIALRRDARLPLDYPANFAAQQLQAYPDIKPVMLQLAPPQAFERALQASRDMGWNVHTVVPSEGRIEAVARTFWFGFEDDVVIRVTATDDGGSRVDARSTGRLGRRDGGANAKRVQGYIKSLAASG
jgi:uncharacterized protein (DUF1499 family)